MEDKPKLTPFLPGLDQELVDQRDRIQSEIDGISRKAMIEDFEVVRQILHMTKDPKTINRLSKALALVARQLPELNELNSKLSVLHFANKNPDWFAMAFHNETSIDEALTHFQNNSKDI